MGALVSYDKFLVSIIFWLFTNINNNKISSTSATDKFCTCFFDYTFSNQLASYAIQSIFILCDNFIRKHLLYKHNIFVEIRQCIFFSDIVGSLLTVDIC